MARMRRKFTIIFLIWLVGISDCLDVDDVSDIKTAKKSELISLKTFEVPAGVTLELTNLLPGTVVEFDGILTFGYCEWTGPLIKISGVNVSVVGKPGNLINCEGERWWDGLGTNGGKFKPKFFEMTLNDSTVTGLNVKNSPAHVFSIRDCSNVNVTHVKIDNSEGDVKGGHNTDGFDVNSQNVRISNCWVHNQDDCLAINMGSDVVFEDTVCIGGHGISIGSIGFRPNNIVERVTVKHCEVINSTNGIRIKTKTNATGWVNDVTYEDVLLKNVSQYGILIHGNYQNRVGNMKEDPTPGVPITNLKVSNVRGTVDPMGTNVYVALANASNWTWTNIEVSGGSMESTCQGIPIEVNTEICRQK
uniref:endo-polygalacturonase n=1 Tax=Lygus hesperus TaxID=30085 RepID=A0A0A9X913_LYGHE